jgi:transcriptional regulator with PAS, ATPase and Fis domain
VVLLDSDSGQPWMAPAEVGSKREPAVRVGRSGSGLSMVSAGSPLQPRDAIPGMIGSSEAMLRVYRLARLVASRMTTVLILGASGTGKELVARGIHQLSPRSGKPFVVVNCAAIPESLLESELFGYVRGAFTGAVQAQAGRIQAAQGGTLFLDEIGEFPLGMQAKLLRFLESREVQRLGSTESTRADVRIVAATNTDLSRKVEQGEFREDLYYRLSAFPLELPPLADRRADIVPLVQHFLANFAAHSSSCVPCLSEEAVRLLQTACWRGNVRELQHVIERSLILAEDSDVILPEHLFLGGPQDRAAPGGSMRVS